MATGVRISAKRRFGQFFITKPAEVSVDGLPVATVRWWGDGVLLETTPGRHAVQVGFRYMGKHCAEGQEVALLYRSPWLVTMKGSLAVR